MVNLSNLCRYYKDCVFEDGSDAILAQVIGNDTTYIRLDGVELSIRESIEFTSTEKDEIKNFIIQTLIRAPNSSFWYGYPISFSYDKAKKFIKPVFYTPLKYDPDKNPIFELISPRINKDALNDLGVEHEVSKKFAEDIGLFSDQQNDLNFSDLGKKLQEHFPKFNYNVRNNFASIFFKGAIFSSEQSKYTQGLDKELTALVYKYNNTEPLIISSLKCFIEYNTNISVKDNNFDLFEVFELNEIQKKAVISAFENKLTVVTGPPGTGKSQVVASIVLNAAVRNEKVLFASKNHKAVKVVEEKLNRFTEKPFIIRLGKQDDELNDLKRAVIDYLTWLSHATPDPSKEEVLSVGKKKLTALTRKKHEVFNNLENLRNKRNIVLKCFKQFEDQVSKLGKAQPDYLIKKLKETNEIKKFHLLNKRIKITVQYLKTLNYVHKIKYFEQTLDEFEDLNRQLIEESANYFKLWLEALPSRLDDNKRNLLNQLIYVLNELLKDLSKNDFKNFINRKDELMNEVADFLHTWCVTNLSSRGEIPLIEGFFDLVVIDEASQCDIASAVPLLYRSKRAVILGDPYQLKHITTIGNKRSLELLKNNGINSTKDMALFDFVTNSLYDLSENSVSRAKTILLNEHFRSHGDIIAFSNKKWYNSSLLISTDYRNLFPKTEIDKYAVEWIDVIGEVEQEYAQGAFIKNEISEVIKKVIELIRTQKFRGEIGVVTPFRLQANKIRQELNIKLTDAERLKVLVDTSVKFQGDEKDIIIYSPVVADNMPKGARFYYQETPNLLNVAITRARAKLIVIGNQKACFNSDINHIKAFARFVKDLLEGKIRTIEEKAESPYEKILYKAMLEAGLKPIPQYTIGQYRLDFALFSGAMQIDVEVDGKINHWSSERLKADIVRNQRLKNLGWKVLRFWTYEIRDKLDYCIKRIQNELKT